VRVNYNHWFGMLQTGHHLFNACGANTFFDLDDTRHAGHLFYWGRQEQGAVPASSGFTLTIVSMSCSTWQNYDLHEISTMEFRPVNRKRGEFSLAHQMNLSSSVCRRDSAGEGYPILNIETTLLIYYERYIPIPDISETTPTHIGYYTLCVVTNHNASR
jgi:hypothetical protein